MADLGRLSRIATDESDVESGEVGRAGGDSIDTGSSRHGLSPWNRNICEYHKPTWWLLRDYVTVEAGWASRADTCPLMVLPEDRTALTGTLPV
jgi:hypothetical protein